MEYRPGEVFYVASKLAEEERLSSNITPYATELNLNNVNKKIKGTSIVGIDTFRGCEHDCLDCYANRMSRISRKDFAHAVPVLKFNGKIQPHKIYRFGTVGDPDHDWGHTSFVVKTMKDKGLDKYFFISKLQSIEGIDPDHVKNLQVSVDPLNKKHFFKSLKNVLAIRGHVDNIAIRLRTINSKNRDINRLMSVAILFAQKHNIPILETKIKFSKKSYLEDLECFDYERIHSTYQTRGSILRDQFATMPSCDPFNTGSCIGCYNCQHMADDKELEMF